MVLATELRGAVSREALTVLLPRRSGRPSRVARAAAIGLVGGIALAETVHAARDRSAADPRSAMHESPTNVEPRAESPINASEKRTVTHAIAGSSDGVLSPASAAPPASPASSLSKVVERTKPIVWGHGEWEARIRPTAKTSVPTPTPEALAGRPSEAKQHYLLELP